MLPGQGVEEWDVGDLARDMAFKEAANNRVQELE